MQPPDKPANEAVRLAELRTLQVLDTAPEDRYDRVTRVAQRLFDVPIALVSLVDDTRQWFKSCQGLDATETSRDVSFCGHAILGDEIFVIPDAARDLRFRDNPLVTGEPRIRFYAGFPISGPDGATVGTLCIIDRKPRDFGADDRQALIDLGRIVERELASFHLATVDQLTRITNRRGFETLGRKALALCQRTGHRATLLFFDLDRFKQINDTFGHAAGDSALRQFAAILRDTFRNSDVIGRISGDEFTVLLTNVAADDVQSAIQRLATAVEQHNAASQLGYAIGYSLGAADFDADLHVDINDLIAAADRLMYRQKTRRKRDADKPGT
jgi:diguanylate cyclase (GGDEF)-like protein